MKLIILSIALLTTACVDKPKPPENIVADAQSELAAAAQTVTIGTKDGNKIFADHVPVEHGRATIILFHQAGSSSYEYADIAPRLNALGYSTLVVDQRSGGNLYGPNRTVIKYGKSAPDYVDALPDLEAALNWARLQGQPVILWGSSYSASLALRVAADNPTLVAAVLAFSPGEYFEDKRYVRAAAARIAVPVFITQAMDARELAQSEPIFDALSSKKKTLFKPSVGGVHGSSTLRTDRNPTGYSENWRAVLQFLKALKLPRS
jgi:pimeloyl-ACP methyl ester carboxylesterase